jgi:acyl-CoA synthetase (AMP-forming)/AMP-acid ligase II
VVERAQPIGARSLWELVERRAAATPEALFAVDDEDRSLSFAGYRDAALRCAAGLATRGVGAGTPVSWQLPTRLDSMVLAGALARLGALQNPILPIYRERELRFMLRQTRARFLFVPGVFRGFDHAELARRLAREQAGLLAIPLEGALPDGDPAGLPPPPAPSSPADAPVRFVFYTSGTTSDPKGALHTDHTLMAPGRALVDVLELVPEDRVALAFPFTHIGGMSWLCAGLLSGCAQIAIAVFDPKRSIDALARHGVTLGTAGTAFHQAYLAAQRERGGPPIFPRARAYPGGGAPKPPRLHFDVKRELGGVGIVSGWGMTECPIAAMNGVRDPDEKLAATEGRATRGVEIAVVRPDGSRAGPGEPGELRVRGPQLCRGYLDASLDADGFDAAGFFRSGDLGYVDAEGYVVITGRQKDVIIRKGENISAKEVEDLLYPHPKVADAAVIGLPDPELGERCCAVVACRDPADPLRFEEMVEFLTGQGLLRQKLPERLELVDAVPRNPTGKILKDELRRRFAGGASG